MLPTSDFLIKLKADLKLEYLLLFILSLVILSFLIFVQPLYFFGTIIGLLIAFTAIKYPNFVVFVLAFYIPLEEFIEYYKKEMFT